MSKRWGGTSDDAIVDEAGNRKYARRMRFWSAMTAGRAPSGAEFTAFFANEALTVPVAQVLTTAAAVSVNGEWGPVWTADGVTLFGGGESVVGGAAVAPSTLVELPARGPFLSTDDALAIYGTLLTPPTTVTYNPDGSVATQVIGGITTTYVYNPDGTVATETRAGVVRTYTYVAGNLTAVA